MVLKMMMEMVVVNDVIMKMITAVHNCRLPKQHSVMLLMETIVMIMVMVMTVMMTILIIV